jgi:hypothetical protein
VTDEELTALIHAELDGDLSSEQRADLARLLLADPQARASRDELRLLCSRLDAVGQVEPPLQLKESILKRLPSAQPTAGYRQTSFRRWRLAAMVVGLLTAGTAVYETVQGPVPGSREIAGTMTTYAPTVLESAALDGGPVSGSAVLYRDKSGLAVGLEVSAAEPVEVLIATQGQSFVVKGLGGSDEGNTRRTIALPGITMQGQDIELTLLVEGHAVQHATLHAPALP